MRATVVVLVLDGETFEVANAVSQAVHASVTATGENDPILRACEAVPDAAVGPRGSSPGAVWEPVRRAIAAKRALAELESEERDDDEVEQ